MVRITQVALASLIFLCASCANLEAKENKTIENKIAADQSIYTACEEPRPEICTREYRPVCAIKLTDVQCVTTPCPSSEEVSYATGCTACADPKVLKYKKGACH